MIRRPPRSTLDRSSAASDVYKRQRGPLSKRQVLRSPALISACPKAGCHAVLAFLSKRYPPLRGRSPTRYSPVCHSVTPCGVTAFDLHVLGTPPALILSQDQTLMLDGLPHAPGRSPCGPRSRRDRTALTQGL